jgi:FMN phosphatase YigB (HAD superfamily)
MEGDNYELDIAPAIELGMKGLWFNEIRICKESNRNGSIIKSFLKSLIICERKSWR